MIAFLAELGGWDGTWATFLVELKRKKRLEISAPTLGRYLKNTKYAQRKRGNPHQAARVPGKRSGETEGVADDGPVDMSGIDSYTMPDDE